MKPSKVTTTIIPFLVVNNCLNAIAFYLTAFGAEEMARHNMPDEKWMAKIAIDGAEFWISDEEPAFNNFSPASFGGTAVRIVLTVANPDTFFTSALKAGATQICPVTTEDFWRIGKLLDPFGHTWEIGCPLDDETG